jgi:hypothetical protein
MFSIRVILGEFKDQWTARISRQAVDDACQQARYSWRQRLLSPLTTIQLFFLQILHGNTASSDLRHLSGMDFSASGYCQARMRLPLEVIQRVARRVIAAFAIVTEEVGLWHGHRLWLTDGTGFSMPDTPELEAYFGQPSAQKAGCGFPVASVLALCDASTGLVVDVLPRPLRVHDMSGIVYLHEQLCPGDVLVGDRAFCSYAHLALLLSRGLHGVFRQHPRSKVNFRKFATGKKRPQTPRSRRPSWQVVKKLARFDEWVDFAKPKRCPDWMSPQQYQLLPDTLRARVLRYAVRRRGYRTRRVTLVTTLLDRNQYPAEELAQLYGGRWAVELNFRHLKTTMQMDVLHCETVQGVLKELWMFLLVYNLVRMVMLEAARRQHVPVDRIAFVDALRWLAHAQPGTDLPDLVVNPSRPGRIEPRVRKRRPKPYPLMTRPRNELRKELLHQKLQPI